MNYFKGDINYWSTISDKWTKLAASLSESGKNINLQALVNAVDEVWESMGSRPERPKENLITLSIDYSGKKPPPLPSSSM